MSYYNFLFCLFSYAKIIFSVAINYKKLYKIKTKKFNIKVNKILFHTKLLNVVLLCFQIQKKRF